MNLPRVWIGLGLGLSGLTVAFVLRDDIVDLILGPPSRIEAKIKLNNLCDMQDDMFVVRDLTTARYATFRAGIARLPTMERNRVQIEFAPRFVDVSLTASSAPARRAMTMTAKCSSKNWNKGYFEKD